MFEKSRLPRWFALGTCVLASHSFGLTADASASSGEPPAEPEQGQHIKLLDDFETLWANRSEPDEGEYAIWVRAVTAPTAADLSTCAFTMWDVGRDRDWRESRFDPNQEPQWQLVSVGGSAPSEEELAKFDGQFKPPIKTAHFEEDGETIPLEALAVLHRTDDAIFFGAMPHTFDGTPRSVRKMQPLYMVVVTRDDAHVRIVDVRATKPYSIGLGMRVSSMHNRIIYGYEEAVGAVVTKYGEVKMRGKAFVIAKFELDESRWYGDVSCDSGTGPEPGEQK